MYRLFLTFVFWCQIGRKLLDLLCVNWLTDCIMSLLNNWSVPGSVVGSRTTMVSNKQEKQIGSTSQKFHIDKGIRN